MYLVTFQHCVVYIQCEFNDMSDVCFLCYEYVCNGLPSRLPLLSVDHRPPHAARGLPAQRGVHPHAPHGRAPHRRADAVQSRRETLPRPLLRQQAQLVSAAVIGDDLSSCCSPPGKSCQRVRRPIIILSWPCLIICLETTNGSGE